MKSQRAMNAIVRSLLSLLFLGVLAGCGGTGHPVRPATPPESPASTSASLSEGPEIVSRHPRPVAGGGHTGIPMATASGELPPSADLEPDKVLRFEDKTKASRIDVTGEVGLFFTNQPPALYDSTRR